MSIAIINPGSGPVGESGAWTDTYEAALRTALEWLDEVRSRGIRDVHIVAQLHEGDPEPVEGRWTFVFRHEVTGVEVELQTHGLDNIEAYRKRYIFDPRVYWRGDSSATPKVEDWLAPGFEVVKTLRPIKARDDA